MKVKINKLTNLSDRILTKFGYSKEERSYCTELLLEGELTGKFSHGFNRLISMKKMIDEGKVQVNSKKIEIKKETTQSILVDGKRKTGFYVIPKTFDIALEKVKKNKVNIFCGGVFNTSPAAGMVGYYARKAAEENLIYLGFHNSMSYLIPFGAKKSLFGTNPVTIGIPTNDIPVIWDCSSSKVSVGSIVLTKKEGKKIPKGIALDENGKPTLDPEQALKGGILPFSEHKGSGMAMIVELLAGALTGSSIRKEKQWNWGSFFILINPSMFRPIDEFKNEVEQTIKDLKALSKAKGFKQIYYPGERSQNLRRSLLKKGKIEVNDVVYKELENVMK